MYKKAKIKSTKFSERYKTFEHKQQFPLKSFRVLFFHVFLSLSGTEKVRQALGCKHLHVVNPDWLWGCLERWERVEERLFPLKEDYNKSHRYFCLVLSLTFLSSHFMFRRFIQHYDFNKNVLLHQCFRLQFTQTFQLAPSISDTRL